MRFPIATVSFLFACAVCCSWLAEAAQVTCAPAAPRELVRIGSAGHFAPDGEHLAVLTSSSGLVLIAARDGHIKASVTPDKVWEFRFTGGGRYLIWTGADGTAHLWRFKGQKLIDLPAAKDARPTYAAVSDDGTRILSADSLSTVWLSGLGVPGGPRVLEGSLFVGPGSTPFVGGGTLIVTHRTRVSFSLWSMDGEERASLAGAPSDASGDFVTLDEGGRWLFMAASPYENRWFDVWDLLAARYIGRFAGHPFLRASGGRLPSLDAARARVLAAEGNSIVVWDLARKRRIAKLGPCDGPVRWAQFSPDGTSVLVMTDRSLERWRIQEPKRLHRLPLTSPEENLMGDFGAYFSPAGKLVVVQDGILLSIVDPMKGKEIGSLGYAFAAYFSPDEDLLLTHDDAGGNARLWYTRNATLLHEFQVRIEGGIFSPAGDRLVLQEIRGDDDRQLSLWELPRWCVGQKASSQPSSKR